MRGEIHAAYDPRLQHIYFPTLLFEPIVPEARDLFTLTADRLRVFRRLYSADHACTWTSGSEIRKWGKSSSREGKQVSSAGTRTLRRGKKKHAGK